MLINQKRRKHESSFDNIIHGNEMLLSVIYDLTIKKKSLSLIPQKVVRLFQSLTLIRAIVTKFLYLCTHYNKDVWITKKLHLNLEHNL